ncbi:hypothetical protein [Micromonospora sp. WMMD712]|uniref:hypothetical protein n=1 Tax=Micromonospora sp. WMMD712 TaxID=3016096 RepID=UPI00249C6C61|nr:hypothetical protein [Micromonospora sp. WMMD712]WFE59543.1 hypothetical protein O7633_23015 [Micromonospora sp. WMMD712]
MSTTLDADIRHGHMSGRTVVATIPIRRATKIESAMVTGGNDELGGGPLFPARPSRMESVSIPHVDNGRHPAADQH